MKRLDKLSLALFTDAFLFIGTGFTGAGDLAEAVTSCAETVSVEKIENTNGECQKKTVKHGASILGTCNFGGECETTTITGSCYSTRQKSYDSS